MNLTLPQPVRGRLLRRPAIDADTLDAKVLEALRDFYTNRLDQALDAITASRTAHHRARAGYQSELTAVDAQLEAKEDVVDRYLTEYEDNKIDRDTVARADREDLDQIRQLRHRRDELIFLMDVDEEDPTHTYLIEIRDQIAEIIATGSVPERKSMCEALLAELRIDGGVATPIIRLPLSRDDTPLILQQRREPPRTRVAHVHHRWAAGDSNPEPKD